MPHMPLRLALLSACLALFGATAQAGEIAVIVKTTNSTFWQNVNKGAEAGMKEKSKEFRAAGAEVYHQG